MADQRDKDIARLKAVVSDQEKRLKKLYSRSVQADQHIKRIEQALRTLESRMH